MAMQRVWPINQTNMNKFPFTEKGVQDLLSELYQLPDDLLKKEADALLADYRNWVSNHFVLEPTQLDFLKQIDDRFINQAASFTAEFMLNRAPIILIKPAINKENAAKDGEGKIIDLGKKSKTSYSDESGFGENESLTYTIFYQ